LKTPITIFKRDLKMLPTRYASFFKRLVAHVIDVFICGLIMLILIMMLGVILIPGAILKSLFGHWWPPFCLGHHPFEFFDFFFATIPVTATMLGIIGAVFSYWLYFALFESSRRQATPGKMMMGIFVTDLYGQRISFQRALGRTLGKVLSKLLCYFGYLLALFTARNQALHDLLADTLVLEPDYRPAPPDVYYPSAGPAVDPRAQGYGPGTAPPQA